MASKKFSLDRLKKKYNFTVEKLKDILAKIFRFNSEKITNKVSRLTSENLGKKLKRVVGKDKKILMPEINEISPTRLVFIKKSTEKGIDLSNTLKDRLTKNLRDIMEAEGLIATRGVTAGKVKLSTIKKFEKSISKTFENYTKTDPKFGMPSNIHTIAVTEVRASVNNIKNAYADKIAKKNDLVSRKRWIHNRSLSKVPRPHHIAMDKKTIGLDELFVVNTPRGTVKMKHPHDPSAPVSEIINCNCDIEYLMQSKKK